MHKLAVDLGPVQETLLIPLLGRAEATQAQGGLLHDPKAVEIVQALDYDFDKWRGGPSLLGTVLRTRLFDEQVKTFLAQHPRGTVVEIGVGLNTRFERLDNGHAHWLELDLPDAMALRRRFFNDTERRTMLEASALDADWHTRVDALPGPVCFVSEAVIIYFDTEVVEPWLQQLARRFPQAWLITDTTSSRMVDGQARHDAMRHLSQASWFRWRCDDPRMLERLGLRLASSVDFADAPPSLVAQLPRSWRFVLRWAPWLLRRKLPGYRINRLEAAPGGIRDQSPWRPSQRVGS